MKRFLAIKLLFLMILMSTAIFAADSGTLSVFTFKDGKPLKKSEVAVGGKSYFVDKDGHVEIALDVGAHQIEIFGKDVKGLTQGYYKKPVTIVGGQETEVIAAFYSDKAANTLLVEEPKADEEQKSALDFSKVGTLIGTVLTSDKGVPISNARVFVKGTSIDARTDDKGMFTIEIPADQPVSISVVHSEYSAQTLNDIVVQEGAKLTQEIKLTPASMELEEFVVLAPKVKGSISAIMAEEKESKSIVNILGSEEMSKKGDSDAASALKRVTGVTLVGGKDIYVRGLGERYSNIEMNSMPLPSPNPIKRVVPLDIFPSGVISSLKVQKSGTADIPGAFGGGYVDIRTKGKANEDYFKISFGVKGNRYTGDDANTYQGSDTDWLGFDDGYRDINKKIYDSQTIAVGEPLELANKGTLSPEEVAELSKLQVERAFNVTDEKLPLGGSFGLELAQNFDIDGKSKISIFASYAYEQEHRYRDEEYFKYDIDKASGQYKPNPTQYGNIYLTTDDYSHSAIFNVGYAFYDVFHIKYTKLYTKNSLNTTKISDGILGSNDEDNSYFYLNWEERDMDVDQVTGDMDYVMFDLKSNFSLGGEWAKAKLNQPNNYFYIFFNPGELINDENYYLKMNSTNNLATSMKSEDNLYAGYIRNKIELPMTSDADYLEVGFSLSTKERESRTDKFALKGSTSDTLSGGTNHDIDTIYYDEVTSQDTPTLLLESLFSPANYYDAEVFNRAFYGSLFINPVRSLEILVGARMETFKQTVYEYKQDTTNPDPAQQGNIIRDPHSLEVNKLLPSVGVKLKLNKSNYIDFAYSQTYIAPDIREFTSNIYSHPYEVADIIGNPDLNNTDITSFDLKYSHFFSDVESIKVGLFYKYLDNPIEDSTKPSSSLPRYSYINSDEATLYGIEFDGRKSFDFIASDLRNFFVGGNFSYTDSDVTLTDKQAELYTSNHRQLQGLSQTVVNLFLGYETRMRSAVLAYNKMGERIRKIGYVFDGDRYPDDIEVPPGILDFVWIERYENGLSFKIKLGNLLDEETIWKSGNKVTRRFTVGYNYSASLSYKF